MLQQVPTQRLHAMSPQSPHEAQAVLENVLHNLASAVSPALADPVSTRVIVFFIGVVHLLITWVEAHLLWVITHCLDQLEEAPQLIKWSE